MIKTILTAITALLVLAACKKEKENPAPQPVAGEKITTISYPEETADISYNSAGNIKEIFFKANDNSQQHKNVFSYDNNGKLFEMNATDGTKLKYAYPAANKTVIDFITAGSPLFKGEFSYSNGKLSKWIQYGFFSGPAAPFAKSVYTYNTAGNITKEELFEYNGTGWIKTGQIEYTAYDDKKNYSAQLESHIYLLNDPLLANNPLAAIHKDAAGNIIKRVTHQYTYDSRGKKLSRKTTTNEVGVPELAENITYTYQ